MKFDAKKFEREVMKVARKKVEDVIRQKLGTIRHPETGEFPTVAIHGESLEALKAQVEGSPELMKIVKERLAHDDNFSDIKDVVAVGDAEMKPVVFLSYASEDKELAENIAQKLQQNGIDTWWDEWCINDGDSLRQKIDEGLTACTHFIVLLTPISIKKRWVNEEIDAAFVRMVDQQCKFIPLRHDLPVNQLSPLLKSRKTPEIKNPEQDIQSLINSVYGVTKKPPLGSPPEIISTAQTQKTGYSPAATAIAKIFVERTKTALPYDPQIGIEEISDLAGLSEEDIEDAVHELGHMAGINHRRVFPKSSLFVAFDKFWMEWDPAEDALKLAADVVNDKEFPASVPEIATLYGWNCRRMNVALNYLVERNIVMDIKIISGEWIMPRIHATAETRRFVRSRS